MSDEMHSLVALNLVPGLGPRLTAALLNRFGSAVAALQATAEQLREVPHIGNKLSRDLHQAMRTIDVAAELDLMARHEVRVLALGSAEYPKSLVEIPDPPHVLYVRGTVEERDAKAVAIVGSRHCTAYGKRVAERLAQGLVHKGYTVISGLARGIDGAAHRGALAAGGRTLAVLAGGLAKIYPPEHADLAREVSSAGALLTESAMGMQPLAAMFPARNRLISGLAKGVVVVEAAEQSGALITARHAAEQGRAIFAVPGPIDSAASAGTHRLIRDGAILVRHVDDILEDVEGVASAGKATPTTPARTASSSEPPPGLTETQRRMWDFLADQPRHVDELTRHLGLPVAEVAAALMMMEMKKSVRRLPGNTYERTS